MYNIDFTEINEWMKFKLEAAADYFYNEPNKPYNLWKKYIKLYHNDWGVYYSIWFDMQRRPQFYSKKNIKKVERELREIYYKKEPELAKKVYAEIFNLQEKGESNA